MDLFTAIPTICVLLLLGCAVFLVVRLASGASNAGYQAGEESFSQAGVTVDYTSKTVDINGSRYPASKIKSIRWVSNTQDGLTNGTGSRAVIAVDDFDRPTHTIKFITPNAAETFAERMSLALEKVDVHLT